MKALRIFSAALLLLAGAVFTSNEIHAAEPVKVIFDTDMCLDVDDVGALAAIHGLQNEGKCELLGVCYNEVHPLGASVIDAINTWYNRGDIPIGIYKNYEGRFHEPDPSDYFDAARDFDVDNMPHDPFDNIVGCARAVYKHLLRQSEDHSVVIISVGFLNNLYDLLKDPEGYELVKSKVKFVAAMGGVRGDDFNFTRHDLVDQSKYVLENWPGLFAISDAGGSIDTGETLTLKTPVNNPVRRAYELEWEQGPCIGRCSWDGITVLYAVYGTKYFKEITEGEGYLRDSWGYPIYTWKFEKNHRIHVLPKNDKEVEDELERLMTLPPIK